MATDPLDIPGLLQAAGTSRWAGMPAGTTMGHVHLHVGDLAQASDFYSEAIGFDRMVWHYPGALFLAAAGYHHHLGTNTWAGNGAVAPGSEDARLLEWTMGLPQAAQLREIGASLGRSGYTTEWEDKEGSSPELVTRDPWGTQLRFLTTEKP
jgi:catechol 2,3-dioxygenase